MWHPFWAKWDRVVDNEFGPDVTKMSYTHWHPDQPTAPTSSPGETRPEKTVENMRPSGKTYESVAAMVAGTAPGETTLEDACNAPKGSFAKHLIAQREAGGPESYAMTPPSQSQTPHPLDAYPNLDAILNNTISGRFTEWPLVAPEIKRFVAQFAQLETAVAAAKEELATTRIRFTAFEAGAANLRADRDALAEKLRRVEGERKRAEDDLFHLRLQVMTCNSVPVLKSACQAQMEQTQQLQQVELVTDLRTQLRELGEQLEGDGEHVGLKETLRIREVQLDETRTRLAALQQQVGEGANNPQPKP